ncbi:uncharacterized protein LOC126999252 isoform X2 [Eriocheir sinensis]|nr:uncharacterized protein LOC126999252 isoform X2 [Eriocheir sinensis]XP_050717601.1 uncharacterized protein LOC126999252 isoform X2 [Eriocheir sinensis]
MHKLPQSVETGAMSLWESPYAPALTEVLGILNEKTLKALAITATANRLLPVNKKEATELILRYTNSLARLFSYKKMTSQVLIDYLHKKKVPMRIGASKTELIDIVREELEKSIKTNKPDRNDYLTPFRTTSKAQDSSVRKRGAIESPLLCPPSSSTSLTLTTNKNAAVNLSVNAAVENMSLDVHMRDSRNVTTSQSPHPWPPSPSMNLHLNTSGTTVSLDVQQTCGGGGEISEVFARDFCQWFYTMVNRLQPEAVHLPGDSLTVDAFVANSSVDVYLYSGQKVVEKHAVGQEDAFTTLRDTLLECGVCFAPNTDKGPCCEMSKFGMVKLQCSGTLHRCQALVGVFEQEFGLVRCPDGRWKVMVLKLNLKQA